jgi:iron complex outermembrane recepter protein
VLAKDSNTQVDFTGDERQYLAPSLTWRPNPKTGLTMYAHYQRDESDNNVGFFPWEGTLLTAPNGQIPVDTFIGEPDWDTYGGDRTRVGYQFSRQLTAAWKLRHSVRHDTIDGHLAAMYANFFEGGLLEDGRSVNRTWYVSNSDTRITNADALVEGRLRLGRTQHTVLFGVDGVWSRNLIQDVEGEATPLDVYTPAYGTSPLPELEFGPASPTRTRQVGFIMQDQVKIDDRWIVLAGARRDYAKNENEDAPDAGSDDAAWTRRVGLVYLAKGGLAPYASYSDSFEAVAGANIEGSRSCRSADVRWKAA